MRASPERPSSPALHDRAADDLRFIRATMERASTFTAVSGRGYILLGISAALSAFAASRMRAPAAWLYVWGGELILAAIIAVAMTAAKARRLGMPLSGGAGRKLLLGFTPVMAAGGALTAALIRSGAHVLLPGTWLAVYGAAVIAGGVFSIRPVPMMGAAFLVLGIIALLVPAAPGDAMLALGFGGCHIIWGILIARRHGG